MSLNRFIFATNVKLLFLTFTLLLGQLFSGKSPLFSAGKSRFLENRRVEYVVGNLPIIITAPHGGKLFPSTIPRRWRGKKIADIHTDLLAREIAQAFYSKTGKLPHVIICHLASGIWHLPRVGCNRTITIN